jgi:dihydroflavonol-4-reductase
MNILVTGATGFLGNVFVPALLKSPLVGPESKIRVFAQPNEIVPASFAKKVEVVRGDLRNPESVRGAVAGAGLVFHLAGLISYRAKDEDVLMAVNRDGAAGLAAACADAGVQRLVHVSSVGAIGFNPDGRLSDEETPFNWPDTFHYMTSKKAGQEAVLEIGEKRGLEVIVLNPASIMGPGDPKKSTAHNQLYGMMLKRPFFLGTFAGGLAVVDVRDFADLLLAAATRGAPGSKYLAVGANVPYGEVLATMARRAGKKFLPLVAPPKALKLAGAVFEKFADLTGISPLLTESYGALSGWTAYYSAAKSIAELGARYRDIEETIGDGLDFYRANFLNTEEKVRA